MIRPWLSCIISKNSVELHDDHGHYFGRVWFFRDITERKRGEAALCELARHNSLTGEFNRRHEHREPLSQLFV